MAKNAYTFAKRAKELAKKKKKEEKLQRKSERGDAEPDEETSPVEGGSAGENPETPPADTQESPL